MSRVARAVVAGQPHHVTQRGNRRAAVFHADEERRDYLRWMREYAALHGVAVWACCLMTNHAHWLLVPRQADALARALRGAHTAYAFQYNTRHQTNGHLWQGRPARCQPCPPQAWLLPTLVAKLVRLRRGSCLAMPLPWKLARLWRGSCFLRNADRPVAVLATKPPSGSLEDKHMTKEDLGHERISLPLAGTGH